MRIIAGKYKGRTLQTPKTQAIRPTSDRLRETLFNVLAHNHQDSLENARALDLFAGTGALGIEALSRGAAFCLFIDEGVEARGIIRGNVEALGLTGHTKIFKRDATKLGAIGTLQPFELVFCDPPYGKGLAEKALLAARAGSWLKKNALVVVEENRDIKFGTQEGFDLIDTRQASESILHFFRFTGG